MTEVKTDFENAFNASGEAIRLIAVFGSSLVLAALQMAIKGMERVRTEVMGADWVIPGRG